MAEAAQNLGGILVCYIPLSAPVSRTLNLSALLSSRLPRLLQNSARRDAIASIPGNNLSRSVLINRSDYANDPIKMMSDCNDVWPRYILNPMTK